MTSRVLSASGLELQKDAAIPVPVVSTPILHEPSPEARGDNGSITHARLKDIPFSMLLILTCAAMAFDSCRIRQPIHL